MGKCKQVYIQTPLGLADELRQSRKDRQILLTALVAITHRRKGIYDSFQLRQFGPLTTNMAEDMANIAQLAFDKVTKSDTSLTLATKED